MGAAKALSYSGLGISDVSPEWRALLDGLIKTSLKELKHRLDEMEVVAVSDYQLTHEILE